MKTRMAAALGALLMASACGAPTRTESPAPPARPAGIPFPTFGNIYDWRAEGTRGIWIESTNRHWYHATFMAPCNELPFADTIGFKTTPPLPLTKFDSIVVRGKRCFFRTFEEVPGPPGNLPPRRRAAAPRG